MKKTSIIAYIAERRGFIRVTVKYKVNPEGLSTLYSVVRVEKDGIEMSLDAFRMNNDLRAIDQLITASDPVLVEFARRELKTDLTRINRKREKKPETALDRDKGRTRTLFE